MIAMPPDDRRARKYEHANAIAVKPLFDDGRIEARPKTGKQILPPSPRRARLWRAAIASAEKYLHPDGSVWDGNPAGGTSEPRINVTTRAFSNTTYSGEIRAIAIEHSTSFTAVAFTGHAIQNAVGTPAQDFVMVDPADFPLLERFIGQVDQHAIGYNANTGRFDYAPIRITAAQGMEIVTPPNIAVGTRFSWNFVLFLVQSDG
jgi:hypothetical protein